MLLMCTYHVYVTLKNRKLMDGQIKLRNEIVQELNLSASIVKGG